MKFANDPLWQKINSFPIDDPASLFPFSRKLAQENNWDADFTQRAIREYKRFIYLCCILHEGASPPPIVDEVWHLHILYSENYWEEFCEKTLGRKLHHNPSKGGSAEKERHVNWLDATIENYRFVFEEEPPEDIWLAGVKKELPPAPIEKSNAVPVLLFYLIVITAVCLSIWAPYAGILIPFTIVGVVVILGMSGALSGKGGRGNGSSDGSSGSGCSGGGDSSCGSSGCGGCGGGGD